MVRGQRSARTLDGTVEKALRVWETPLARVHVGEPGQGAEGRRVIAPQRPAAALLGLAIVGLGFAEPALLLEDGSHVLYGVQGVGMIASERSPTCVERLDVTRPCLLELPLGLEHE